MTGVAIALTIMGLGVFFGVLQSVSRICTTYERVRLAARSDEDRAEVARLEKRLKALEDFWRAFAVKRGLPGGGGQ